MAKIMTLRVKVYTIAELKEANYSAYEKVIEKAAQYVMEYDQQFINEDLTYSLTEYANEQGYEVEKGRGGKGSSLEWDYGRGDYCIWSGQVYLDTVLLRYFAEMKIPSATRAMLMSMWQRGTLDAYVQLRRGYMRDGMSVSVDYDEGDTDGFDPRMIERRAAAGKKFTEWLEGDVNDTSYAMLKMVRDEYDYRTSEEVLAEEIDMNERVFTIDGDDTVWVGRIPEEETL